MKTTSNIHPELKKAIVNYMLENENLFQLVNSTSREFRHYIYDNEGNYIIGGEEVQKFISNVDEQIIQ